MPTPLPATAPCVDVTTTAVGRATLEHAYDSFFSRVSYAGTFRVIVTVDPAYGVEPAEIARTLTYLDTLPERFPQVAEVIVERFPYQAGLAGALGVLFAHATAPIGVHLEDDWEITGPVDLDALIADMVDQDSTAVVLGNEHAARGGTFQRAGEVEQLTGTRVPLLRLTAASWAAGYLPLCPHVHATARWVPTVARALALTDPLRCPDERVREWLQRERSVGRHNVLWTREVLARDIGRDWLAGRGRHKAITGRHDGVRHRTSLPTGEPAERGQIRSHALAAQAEPVWGTAALTSTPLFVDRGEGAVVWDADGNDYLDLSCARGAVTLGHNHPEVTNAVRERASKGLALSRPTLSALTLTRLVIKAVPGADAGVLLRTAADARATAVRLARRHSGRRTVLVAGDASGGPVTPGERFPLGDDADQDRLLNRIRQAADPVAAVVLAAPPARVLGAGFLADLRRACTEAGSLLVMDETTTGFRLAPGGLGELLGVRGDLTCVAHGIASGMAVAAVAGPARLLHDDPVLPDPPDLLSVEVGKATLRSYSRDGYYAHVAALGRRLRDGINAQAARFGAGPVVVGYDAMPCFTGAAATAGFRTGMAARGVLLDPPVAFLSAAHTAEQVDYAVGAVAATLPALAGAGTP